MKSLLDKLKKLFRHFYNKPVFLQAQVNTQMMDWPAKEPQWILGRALCMYRSENFANVPKNRRIAALNTQLKVWSPFEQTGHFSLWVNSVVMVWYWDTEGLKFDEGPDEDWAVYPETVFQSKQKDGTLVQVCQQGFDVQCWRDDVLVESLWQMSEPAELQLEQIAKRVGVERDLSKVSVPAEINKEPWVTKSSIPETFLINETPIVFSLFLILGAIFVWQEVRILKFDYLARSIDARLIEMQEELLPLLEARNALQASRNKNGLTTKVLNTKSQAQLMVMVSRRLPNESALFKEWHYQQGELKFVIEDDNLNPIEYVSLLQAEPLFKQVRAEQARGKDRIQIALLIES
jgi:hypothetical protein